MWTHLGQESVPLKTLCPCWVEPVKGQNPVLCSLLDTLGRSKPYVRIALPPVSAEEANGNEVGRDRLKQLEVPRKLVGDGRTLSPREEQMGRTLEN